MSAGDAVDELVALGLNRNEALAYVSLLEHAGPEGATGYEVGARSGVPRSAVYKILHRLEELGAVFPQGSDPVRYTATDPERFVAHMKHTFDARAARAVSSLGQLAQRSRPEPVWTVSRYDEVMERAEAMIRAAERSVYLSAWPREIDALRDGVVHAAGAGRHVVLHSPTPVPRAPSEVRVWAGDIPVDDLKSAWSHKLILVVDHDQALLGGTEPHADNHAVWTSNPSVVDVAVNHIILDITLLARATGRDCRDDVAPMMRPHLEVV